MRREPFGVGSIVHVVKRGARGMPFLKDAEDLHRLLLQLTHFNDRDTSPYWFRDLLGEDKHRGFERASFWPDQRPLTKVHAFCVLDNHFHLCLEEIEAGGVSTFMQKLGTGISAFLNEKYHEVGSPFQGSYRLRTVTDDAYLRYLIACIEVKNAFEQLTGGYERAAADFTASFAAASRLPQSSLGDHLALLGKSDLPNTRGRGIVCGDLVPGLWTLDEYESFAADVISGRAHLVADAAKGVSRGFA